MKKIKNFLVVLAIFLSPLISEAAVIINEIAWMGGVNSANHEWIELYNTGNENINVDGWTLSDGANLNINLVGNIPAKAFVVLERSSDESSPAPAFLIYTGALVNTGATLTLRNASGQIMDQVAGGENWQNIGGDNTTKDTAQYTSAGWVTDVPTPGAPNRSGRVEPVKSQSSSNTKIPTVLYGVDTPTTVRVSTNSNSNLNLSLNIPDVVYVNQSAKFKAEGSGIAQTLVDSLVYTWNFGDSFLQHGKEVEYAYSYPGTYVVTVNATYAKYDETIRKEIVVLPVSFSITKNEVGDIQINNDAPYDVDVSGFVVKGEKEVVLPPKTIMLPKATITISKNRLGGKNEKLVALYDKKGNMVTSNLRQINNTNDFYLASATFEQENYYEENFSFRDTVGFNSVSLAPATPSLFPQSEIEESEIFLASNGFGFAQAGSVSIDDETEEVENDLETNKETITFKSKAKDPMSENWPYLVFIGLLLLVLLGLYFSKDKN